MTEMTNEQSALAAASLIHQRVNGATSAFLSDTTVEYGKVLRTAEGFYQWLESKSTTEGSK